RAAFSLAAVDRSAGALVGAVALAIGAAALASAILAIWLGRSTAAPIKRLTALASRMSGGQLDSRVDVTSGGELGELARSFNRMADRLQETFGAISAERNRLAAILDTISDGLVVADRSGRVLALNPAA